MDGSVGYMRRPRTSALLTASAWQMLFKMTANRRIQLAKPIVYLSVSSSMLPQGKTKHRDKQLCIRAQQVWLFTFDYFACFLRSSLTTNKPFIVCSRQCGFQTGYKRMSSECKNVIKRTVTVHAKQHKGRPPAPGSGTLCQASSVFTLPSCVTQSVKQVYSMQTRRKHIQNEMSVVRVLLITVHRCVIHHITFYSIYELPITRV